MIQPFNIICFNKLSQVLMLEGSQLQMSTWNSCFYFWCGFLNTCLSSTAKHIGANRCVTCQQDHFTVHKEPQTLQIGNWQVFCKELNKIPLYKTKALKTAVLLQNSEVLLCPVALRHEDDSTSHVALHEPVNTARTGMIQQKIKCKLTEELRQMAI